MKEIEVIRDTPAESVKYTLKTEWSDGQLVCEMNAAPEDIANQLLIKLISKGYVTVSIP